MMRVHSWLFIILLLIASSSALFCFPLTSISSGPDIGVSAHSLIDDDGQDLQDDADVELNTMFFAQAAPNDAGIHYVCRRGVDAIAYFGMSRAYYCVDSVWFTLEFPGSNEVMPVGEDPTGSITNYLLGNDPSKWRTGLADCSVLRYREIYPGVDLAYRIRDGYIKYEFVVEPNADTSVIAMRYSDAATLVVREDRVSVSKDGREMEDAGLWAFQRNTGLDDVPCAFRAHDGRTVGFSVGGYDTSQELVIDPVIFLAYSTFLSGASNEVAYDIAVEDGSTYVTGRTTSSGFPTANPYDSTYNGYYDCFVTKFAADGQSLVYSTFLGGALGDYGQAIAVEGGCAYVAGYTMSSGFPTANAYDSTLGGSGDCFVTKFAADGQSLIYSTFLGGASDEDAWGIAVEDRCAYVTGNTGSSDFPTVNAYDSTSNGRDCFVTKFAADGQSLIYSTFLGGALDDYGQGIAVEDACAYVAGYTMSSGFPTANAYDSTLGGSGDCFVTKFAADGQSLVYSTFLGGSDDYHDSAYAIAVENGLAYVTGDTYSSDFPTANAYDSTLDGMYDCFVTKFAADGQSLVYSTFLGGTGAEKGNGIAVESGRVYVTGTTVSSDFPAINAYDSTLNGPQDCFVTEFAADGQSLIYSTYLGGAAPDWGYGIAAESECAYVTGWTQSSDFPTANAYNSTYGGGEDCFVSVLSHDSDMDGSLDWDEARYGTDPFCIDTDNDNFLDGYEVAHGSDPLDPDFYPGMPYDIAYSSYLGGSSDDTAEDIAVEGGYVYLTGMTSSADFSTVNAFNATHGGAGDVFIVCFAFDCRTIVYSTFLGGASDDYGFGIAVEASCVYVTGFTLSSDFPTINAYDSTLDGGVDCFVTKFAADGRALVYSTFLGGNWGERGCDIAVQGGCAYVTGYTEASGFPIVSAFDSTANGGYDCFVTKFGADGQSLVYSTYLGGASDDTAYSITVETGYAYVTGYTFSSSFPTINAYDSTYNGGDDCFVTKFAADGHSLVYSTFLGGSSGEAGIGIAVESGCAYVTGGTTSSKFPTVNAYDSTLDGGLDCFVTKFAADGRSLVYSTFLGGDQYDLGNGIAVENGYAYATGQTSSTDFPTTLEGTHGLYDEYFVTKLSKHGSIMVYSTSAGGEGADAAMGIAVTGGTAYVTGYTRSSRFPTKLALDQSYGGYGGTMDIFIVVVDLDSDMDGLCDFWERSLGTDPFCIDSDYDNFMDSYEVAYGSDPLDAMSYPPMPQAWYEGIYEDLDGNATLIQYLIGWSNGNSTLLQTVMQQLDDNATLLEQVISWLDGNHTAIETLFTFVDGNATLLIQTVNAVNANSTQLDLLAALVTHNAEALSNLNATHIGDIDDIRAVLNMLGVTVGDTDYDGLDDLEEIALGTNIQCIDTDCDNLNDAYEVKIGTDPTDDDTDNDTYFDGAEVLAGTDPLDSFDYPGSTGTVTTTTTTTTQPPMGIELIIIAGAAGCVGLVVLLVFIRRRTGVRSSS